MASTSDTIQAGEWVIIQRESFVKVHKVNEGSVAMLGRDCVELSNLLNQPKWSTYSLEEKGKKGVRKFSLTKCDSIEFEENVADGLVDEVVDGKDNRFIKDDGLSQKVSKEEIEEMQSEGASAKQIIGHLVENSSTFDQKTAYAKEKYVNKKQKKYKRTVLVRPTSLRLILQSLAGPSQDYNKILGIRTDSLSQLVYMSGAQSGAGPTTFLIFESGAQGIVTAAMLERVGADPEAHLIVVGPTRGTNKCISVQAMNFPEEQLAKVHYVTLAGLLSRAKEEGLISSSTNATVEESKIAIKDEKIKESSKNENEKVQTDVAMETENGEKATKRPAEDNLESPVTKRALTNDESEIRFVIARLKQYKADCLVVAGKENPSDIATALLPLVENSRPLVVFSQFREPLQECYIMLKTVRNVTALRLSEPWLRRYQVLTERTHPEVTMSSSGGFLLTGLTVDSTAV